MTVDQGGARRGRRRRVRLSALLSDSVAGWQGRMHTSGLRAPASTLVISKRTLESHVDHIKRKLGHRTRNEVMAWALRESSNP